MPGKIKTSKLLKGVKKVRTLRYKYYCLAIIKIIIVNNIFKLNSGLVFKSLFVKAGGFEVLQEV
jgi:hypothetical protein